MGKRTPLVHLGCCLWVLANSWASWPVHWETPWRKIALSAVVFCNPVVFACCSWIGWRERRKSIAVFWPGMVLMAWAIVPSVGAWHEWGWHVAVHFLGRGWSIFFFLYLALCLTAYIAAMGSTRLGASHYES